MTALAVAAALGLAGSIPVAALCWAVGAGSERLTRAPRLREAVWTVGLAASVLTVGVTVAAAAAAGQPGPAAAQAEGAATTGAQALITAWAVSAEPAGGLELDPMRLAGAMLAAAAAGLAHRFARLWVGRRRVANMVRHARPVQDPALLSRLQAEAVRAGVPPPALLISEDADRPLLVGLRRPAILLPESLARSGGPDRLGLICAHELAHLARGDNLRLLVEEAAAGLLWFNPPFHAVRARLRAAREEVCDASALAGAPGPVRRLYADTLIHTLRPGAGPEPRTAFTGAARSAAMRLHAIVDPARPARAPTTAAACGACLALLAVAGAGSVALAQVAGAAGGPAVAPAPTAAAREPSAAVQPWTAVEASTLSPAVSKAPLLPGYSQARLTVRRSENGRTTVTTPPGSPAMAPALKALAVSAAQAGAEPAAGQPASQATRTPRRGFNCPPPGFCMIAQQVHVRPGEPRVTTFTGQPALYGRTVEDGQLTIDGRPQPAGIDLSTLDPDSIERVEIITRTADGRPQTANTDPRTVKTTVAVITKDG